MKSNLFQRLGSSLVTILLFVFLSTLLTPLFAQDTNAVPISPETAAATANILGGVLAALAGKYGVVLTIVAWVGVLRTLVKPIMLIVEAIVAATPGKADDAAIAKFEAGPIYKWLVWGLDWLASVKLSPTVNTNPLVK